MLLNYKHTTPQPQNHIFKKERIKEPLPYQEAKLFVTLNELKVLERKGRFSMSSDSDSDGHTSPSFMDDANDTSINEDTLTTDGKETYDGEEDEKYYEEQELDTNDNVEEEQITEITQLNADLKRKSSSTSAPKRAKRVNFTMKYEIVEDTW